MNRKIFTILLLLSVVASASAVSAFDLGDLFGANNGEQVTIGGINFTVPDGYEEVDSEYMNQKSYEFSAGNYTVEGKAFQNNGTDVEIVVGNYTNCMELLQNHTDLGNETTISGISGYADEEGDRYIFNYEDSNYLVTITSNDKNAIAEFLIA